jgi:hypothetical protein
MECERSITFLISAEDSPDIQVKAVEKDGALQFIVTVLEGDGLTGDLRGLFFDVNDPSKLAGLVVTEDGGDVTEYQTGNVINLGNGANMSGAAAPFDVGLEFGTAGIGKDDIQTASFTVSNAAGDLTLDDIAHTLFGARLTSVGEIDGIRNDSAKLTALAPAAPDARNDAYSLFEDGQSGLDDPSSVPEGAVFQVLANDTDADGDTLTVTDVFGSLHGTLAIVDGDDADLLPGDAVLYTPDADYAGTDSFTYCISDNNGGTDFAEVAVAIAAVADLPVLEVEVLAGAAVNEVVLRVTATQADADSSEHIDRILASSLPAGVTLVPVEVDPSSEPDQVVQEYLLTLPIDTDTQFDLTFTALAEEASNADQQAASETVAIVYEYNSTTTPVEFGAVDQSIWSSGDEFVFVDDRFIGVNTGNFDRGLDAGPFFAEVDGRIKLGLQSTLTFEGGQIDASADYDVTVETNYNKTTDQLLIDTGALLTGASFVTQGPEGSYTLDFVYDMLIDFAAGVDVDFGTIDIGIEEFDLGGIHEEANFTAVNIPSGSAPGSFNLLALDSASAEGSIEFPPPLNAFSVNYAWPHISTSGTLPPEPVPASGESENFLELELDLDTLVAQLLGLPGSPFEFEASPGPFFVEIDLLDVDVTGGLNFLQQFELDLGSLGGVLTFEDGSHQAFAIGDSLLIGDASQKDALGDGDGQVEFAFNLVPTALLSNETELGFNLGVDIDLFRVEAGYDITIPVPVIDDPSFSDSVTLGPVGDFGEVVPVADITVFDATFALSFSEESVGFFA